MNTLADWYPGDVIVFASLEVLGMITVLVLATAAAERLLGRGRAALRSGLWQAALIGVLSTPVLALLGSQLPWHIAIFPSEKLVVETPPERSTAAADTVAFDDSATPSAESMQPGIADTQLPREEVSAPSRPMLERSRAEDRRSESTGETAAPVPVEAIAAAAEPATTPPNLLHAFSTLGFLVWSLGSAYLVARMAHGWCTVRKLRHSMRPLDGGRWAAQEAAAAQLLSVARLPALYTSPEVRGPLVIGLFTPRIVLPVSLVENCTSRQLRDILVHEGAHIVRRDPWARLLQCLAGVLFWVHPLVALLNRRLGQAREEVCDNHVLTHGDAMGYAETLLTVARFCFPNPGLEGNLTMIPRHHNLERRIGELLEEDRDKSTQLTRKKRVVLLASMILAVAALASIGLVSRPERSEGRDPAASLTQGVAESLPGDAAQASSKGATQPTGEKVTGMVYAADGSPAAGAVVWAAKRHYGLAVRRETIADAAGRYTLFLDPGTWQFRARRGTQGGAGAGWYDDFEIVASRAVEPMTIRLEERGTLRGRLVEMETGKPIAGGRLFLDEGLVLTTDADGRFEVGGLSRKNHEAYIVAAGRRRDNVLFDNTARADTELEVPVRRGGKVIGRVTDENGKPIPGAYVGNSGSGSYPDCALLTACDADGRFEYDGLSMEVPAWLSAYAPGFATEQRQGLVVLAEGKPPEIQFKLHPKLASAKEAAAGNGKKSRVVSGIVRGPDKKPVEDVLVRWGVKDVAGATTAKTDARGQFRVTVPDEPELIAVLPHDLMPQFPAITLAGDQSIEVALKEGPTVKGRVVDSAGKPIQGVKVMPSIQSPLFNTGMLGGLALWQSAVLTDKEGKFTLMGIPERASFTFFKDGLDTARFRQLDYAKDDNVVTMQHVGAVVGRVVDEDGKPVRNFRVVLGLLRDRQPGDKGGSGYAGYFGFGVRFTADDGKFVFSNLVTGAIYRVAVRVEGHGEAVLERVKTIPLNELAAAEPVTFKVGAPIPLTVRTLGPNGAAVAGATVTLVYSEPSMKRAFDWRYLGTSWEDRTRSRTGADGWAHFPGLSFSESTVVVQVPGYARQRLEWRDHQKELKFDLAPEAVLTGEVRNAAGQPLKSFYVRLKSAEDNISTLFGPADKGQFRIGELPAGTWTLTVSNAEFTANYYEGQITLVAGEVKAISATGK